MICEGDGLDLKLTKILTCPSLTVSLQDAPLKLKYDKLGLTLNYKSLLILLSNDSVYPIIQFSLFFAISASKKGVQDEILGQFCCKIGKTFFYKGLIFAPQHVFFVLRLDLLMYSLK